MHILIIGGSRGIGGSYAKAIAGQGHKISVIGNHEPGYNISDYTDICYWRLDLRDSEMVLRTISGIISENGLLDCLVFFQRYRGEGDDWQGEIETSLTATKNIIEALADKFNKSGAIVIMSSLASYFIADEQPLSYHVGKAALSQMARFYAFSLGHRKIRVNSLHFGSVLKEESKDFFQKNKELYDTYCKITPLGRIATTEDVVNAIDFLCSEKSSFITGQGIVLDGGLSIQSHESMAKRISSLKKP
jgi:NAD(P)-dependent dehydrogenase (short-subunit alcohol dehydrogenase family)